MKIEWDNKVDLDIPMTIDEFWRLMEEYSPLHTTTIMPVRPAWGIPPIGYNGGVACDAFVGPCSCGAWH